MKKEEFIKKLRKKLEILDDNEIEDIVSEYEGYIEEKVNRGLTEEEAVSELGDFNEIVSDLLAAYKVKEPKSTTTFNDIINKISKYIDSFMDSISNKSGRDILKLIIEILLILILIWICKIPFGIMKDLGWNLFHELSYPIGRVFYGIWAFLIELCYFILAIVMFIKIIDKRYFRKISERIVDEGEEKIEENNSKKKPKKSETQLEKKQEKKATIKVKKEKIKKEHSIIDTLTNICIFFLKFIVILCLIGVVGYLIGMGFALGIMIYFLISGVKYFGVFILLIAMFLGGILLLELGIDFICNKKIKAWRIFGNLFTIIILTGFGLTLGAVEIANTEIIYLSSTEYNTKTSTKEIKMNNDIRFYDYDNVIIDNNLKDTIKIEYSYPEIEGLNINIDLEECRNGLCLDYNSSHFHLSKGLLDDIIKNLKDKKIYIYNYSVKKTIYISEENYAILKKNNYSNNNPEVASTITKVYQVVSIIDINNPHYMNVTLYSPEEDDTETVKIPKRMINDLAPGKTYNFVFEYYDFYEDNIKELFKYCRLIDIWSI